MVGALGDAELGATIEQYCDCRSNLGPEAHSLRPTRPHYRRGKDVQKSARDQT